MSAVAIPHMAYAYSIAYGGYGPCLCGEREGGGQNAGPGEKLLEYAYAVGMVATQTLSCKIFFSICFRKVMASPAGLSGISCNVATLSSQVKQQMLLLSLLHQTSNSDWIATSFR